MRMLFMKNDVVIKNAADLLRCYSAGFAVHRNVYMESVFYFMGMDGNLYTTNNRGTNEFILSEHEFLGAFERFDELEVYTVVWLAYDTLPWDQNELLLYHRDAVEIYDNKARTVCTKDGLISPEFILNLYRKGSKDIWVFFNFEEETVLPVPELSYIRVLLDDGTIITDYYDQMKAQSPDLTSRIRAYQPVAL